jgi:hypothetical protein
LHTACAICGFAGYNIGVSVLDNPPQHHAQGRDPENGNSHPHNRHAVYATETVGLLLIAGLLLAITLIRYWHYIHWSLR